MIQDKATLYTSLIFAPFTLVTFGFLGTICYIVCLQMVAYVLKNI